MTRADRALGLVLATPSPLPHHVLPVLLDVPRVDQRAAARADKALGVGDHALAAEEERLHLQGRQAGAGRQLREGGGVIIGTGTGTETEWEQGDVGGEGHLRASCVEK